MAVGLLLPTHVSADALIDFEHTLWLINLSAYDAPLQPLAVTFGRIRRGCPICDETKLGELGRDLCGSALSAEALPAATG